MKKKTNLILYLLDYLLDCKPYNDIVVSCCSYN